MAAPARRSAPAADRALGRFLALCLAACFLWPARAEADAGASAFLNEFGARAIAQLTEPGIEAPEQERRFRGLIDEGFDIGWISSFVVGRYWRIASEADRSAFVEAFLDLLVRRFLPVFGQYTGERLVVGAARPLPSNPEFLSVESQITRAAGETIQVEWRVHGDGGAYRIVDIVAQGVSIALTLRSEYASVLHQNGGDVGALARALREKISRL